VKGAGGIVEKVQEAFAMSSFPTTDDPDLMLYQGDFFSDADRSKMLELRGLTAEELRHVSSAFDDVRIDEMLFRYRARNYPDSLGGDERRRWNRHRMRKWRDGAEINAVLARIEELQAAGESASCLEDLREYVDSLRRDAQSA